MIKGCVLSIVVIMLLAPVAFAGILQEQGFGLVAPNFVFRSGPQGTATGGNTATVGNTQTATDALGTLANQQETGILTQSAATAGVGGWSDVTQAALAEGAQVQGSASPHTQLQEMSTTLAQDARKDHGAGTATGGQGFVGEQEQTIAQGAALTTETQIIGAAQHGTVAGSECSIGKSEQNGLTVVAVQGQTNSGCCDAASAYPSNW